MKKQLLSLMSLLILLSAAVAQEQHKNEIFENFISQLFLEQDEDLNYEEFYENYIQLFLHPRDLNTISRAELQSLLILSEQQMNNFFSYRAEAGPFLSMYELQVIPGFDRLVIQHLLLFTTLSKEDGYGFRNLWQRIKDEKNHYLLTRYDRVLETKKGYRGDDLKDPAYERSPFRILCRYRISRYNDFSIGLTLEKDAGEKITWDPGSRRYGFDFISGHLALFNKGRLKALTIGDYQIQAGQGLALGSGFFLGKSSDAIATVRRSHLGIRPYASSLEYGFFRGAAATYNLGKIDITAFYSHKNIDGVVRGDESGLYISSLPRTGYHRTVSEINSRKQVREKIAGSNVSYNSRKKNFHAGVSYVYTIYEYPVLRNPNRYNQYIFNGGKNYTAATDLSYIVSNFNFFGEIAASHGGGKGITGGFISSLSSKADLAMVYRNYSRNFYSFYGNAFGENTLNQNEKGIYLGLRIKPAPYLTFTAYFDRFSFPWLSYRAYAPSQGYEYLTRFTWKLSRNTVLYSQFRETVKEMNQKNNTTALDYLSLTYKKQLVFHLDHRAGDIISMSSRVQLGRYTQTNLISSGYFIMEDLGFHFGKLDFNCRFAIFDTDDYDSRIYIYEKDILYSFSLPALYGKGTRTYLMVHFKILRKTDFWIRYAATSFNDRNVISSANEQINGSKRSEIKLQMRVKF